jgi:hypothetical protein
MATAQSWPSETRACRTCTYLYSLRTCRPLASLVDADTRLSDSQNRWSCWPKPYRLFRPSWIEATARRPLGGEQIAEYMRISLGRSKKGGSGHGIEDEVVVRRLDMPIGSDRRLKQGENDDDLSASRSRSSSVVWFDLFRMQWYQLRWMR